MKTRKMLGAFAFTSALALVLSGCGAGEGAQEQPQQEVQTVEGADYNPQPRENLQEGGEVTFPIAEIPEQMNPNQSNGSANTSTLWNWYNPQMILMTPEGEAQANPAYLTDWTTEVKDGKTVVTYTINPEAKWNDGTPITWESYKVTWEAQSGQNEEYQPGTTDGYDHIESVAQGEDERQAVITFDTEFPWTKGLFWNLMHPSINTPEAFNTKYVGEPNADLGAGPYKIETFDKNGGTITFVPNENWWGEKPLLDKVTFRQLEDVAAMNAFKAGEIDMVGTATKDRMAQVEGMEGVTTYKAQRVANNLFQIDGEKPQFAELEVRKAMMLAINRDQIKEVVWDGLDYTEEDAGSFNLYPFQEGYVDAFKAAGLEFNVEEANSILDEAGWAKGEDGIRTKGDLRLEGVLPVYGDDPIVQTRGRIIQEQLKAIGVEVTVEPRPSADFSNDYSTKNWDIFMLAFTSSDPYGVAWMCQLYCSDSGLNLSGTGTPEMDAKIQAVQSLPTEEEQTKAGMELETEVIENTWGIMPLYAGPSISTVKDGLANLTPEPYSGLDLFGVSPVENVGWEKES